ncbi:A/G-specific adenine glycosylase, partial [Paenibacillus senegalensis]|uniref:A/G-specific adenine glycosylase n=1 Tax=Paenibacillus senegalensis TaxID=1465766 RepID=UPI0002899ECA
MEKSLFAAELLAWYRRVKRDLPWRRSRDPYYIWVSEVMLQQTRVETVIPYFHRFIEKFPTLEALAAAPEEEVVKAWEGLGYYSRARNLQAGAKEVIARYGGIVPARKEDISTLRGVGPYTAGAILSIAYNVPEPAVDGNVMRVLSRFFLITDDIAKPSTRKAMEKLAGSLIPEGAAGDFNQALMEFGATLCTPRSPHCLTCPVMEGCQARLNGMETELPVKAKAKPPRLEPRAAAVIIGTGKHAGKLLIRRRPQQGLLAGMWELPHVLVPQSAASPSAKGQVVRVGADNLAAAEAAAAYMAELSVSHTDSSASGGAAAAGGAAAGSAA